MSVASHRSRDCLMIAETDSPRSIRDLHRSRETRPPPAVNPPLGRCVSVSGMVSENRHSRTIAEMEFTSLVVRWPAVILRSGSPTALAAPIPHLMYCLTPKLLAAQVGHSSTSGWDGVNHISAVAQHVKTCVSALRAQPSVVRSHDGKSEHYVFVKPFPVVEQRSHLRRRTGMRHIACAVRPCDHRPPARRRCSVWQQDDT